MPPDPHELADTARRADADGPTVRSALEELLELDAALGVTTAFAMLAGEPRLKPSRGLLIDPTDSARRRWEQRVSAAASLVGSPSVVQVFHEMADEFAESPELARDVLAAVAPSSLLSATQRDQLTALGER